MENKTNGNGNGKSEDIVGFTSRWDYGADGSRVGLLHKMKETIEEHKADFLVLVGGIVSKRACRHSAGRIRDEEKKMQDKLKLKLAEMEDEYRKMMDNLNKRSKKSKVYNSMAKAIANKKWGIDDLKDKIKGARARSIGQILSEMTGQLALQINKDLPPLFRPDGERMKIYIVTSPAYDGDIGRDVVKLLITLRREENDIRYESSRYEENTTFKIPLKRSGRTFAAVVPTKAVWRSGYYSTNADRLLEDEMKRTAKPLCDFYAIGCGASSINRGFGEMPFQRITVPALHKLEDPRTSENMVGVSVVTFVPGRENCTVKTICMKDMISDESSFTVPPADMPEIQKRVIEEIKTTSGSEASLGWLEEHLGVSRLQVEKALKSLLKLNPKIVDHDEDSQKYFLSQDFLQKEVRYSWPSEPLIKDVLLGFACLHAGSIHTAYDFIVNEMPKLILEHEVTHLLGVGDFIQGLKHDLQCKGEIVSGMNNTVQEQAVGVMVATIMLKVLNMRLEKKLACVNQADRVGMTNADIEALIRYNLIDFLFWKGNHDDWMSSDGHKPLHTMEQTLRDSLYKGIVNILKKFNLSHISLGEIIEDKIHRIKNKTYYTMPSGLVIGGRHYYAGRTSTSSTWCQRALKHMKKAQLCWVANFHVEESVEEWEADKGLRVAMQVPTLMSMSDFEDTKGKTTDFGVGLLKVWSANARIISAETNFLGLNPNTSFDNDELIRSFLDSFGIGQWVDLKKTIK
ncbi:MAG: hypothetical protein Q7S19_02775 [bacterium]|nr:hypothetical protein [bacterium]